MSYACNFHLYVTADAYRTAYYKIALLFFAGETFAVLKTGDALNKLKKLAPQTAIALIDGEEREIDVKAVKVGDIVIVKAGMAFPADGNIISGSCFADESSVNGESLPREKQQGDFVIGGTVS